MSYILDALKKSEQERQRGNVPDIKSIHNTSTTSEREPRRSWWIYLFIVVLLANGAIFAVVYLGGNDDSGLTQASHESSVTSPAIEELASNSPQTVVKSTQPQLAPSRGEANAQQQAQQESASKQQPHPQVIFSKEPLDSSTASIGLGSTPADDASLTQDTDLAANESKAQVDEAVLIAELPESVRQKIPSIEFAGHVYSTTVERRSVMINGKKMREGDVVGSGLLLQVITPDGAEFEYQGYRFKLGALQDWSPR
ncbi:general secretion pathway protein GspB [Kaarinaea lacus]